MDLGVLRELRAEVQDLQAVMEEVRQGTAALATYAGYVQKTMRDIAGLMAGITDGEYADVIRHLHNIWEQMRGCPLLTDPAGQFSAQDQTHHLGVLDTQCRKLVFEIAYLTIPERVNAWLALARPGYYLPFHAVFDDELPHLEDRVKLLSFLQWSPEVIQGGLVDAENGLIYRYSQDPKRRRLSFLLLAAAAAAAVGIVVGASYLPVSGWPLAPQNLATLLMGFAAVVAGVIVHVGVGTAKQMQAQRGRPPIMAVDDIPLLIDARIGPLVLKVLLTLVGFFGLVFAAGVGNVTPLNSFLVGYSLDSVVELFSASIEQRGAAQVATLKQQLGVAAKP